MKVIKNSNSLQNNVFEKPVKCNHDPNQSGETTLIQVSKRCLVHPQVFDFFCPCCKKAFHFNLNENNIFIEREK